MAETTLIATFSMLLGATYTNTLSLGTTIVASLLAFGTLVGILYGAKWKSRWDQAQATIKLYAENAAGHEDRANLALQTAKDLAEKSAAEKDTLLRQLADASGEIGKLKSLPDVAELVKIANAHEDRAQARHDASLVVLQAISDKLH